MGAQVLGDEPRQRRQREQPVVGVEEVVGDVAELAAVHHRAMLDREAVEPVGVPFFFKQKHRIAAIRPTTAHGYQTGAQCTDNKKGREKKRRWHTMPAAARGTAGPGGGGC